MFYFRFSYLFAICLFMYIVTTSPLHARWVTEDEADLEIIYDKTIVKIDEVGRVSINREQQNKVLTEEGRKISTTTRLSYDTTRQKLSILEACTNTKGIDYIISKESIEDIPVPSDNAALEKRNQIFVPFQQVQIGSVLHCKSREDHLEAFCEKYCELDIDFNHGLLVSHCDLTIESALPLFFKLLDPLGVFELTESFNDELQTIHLTLKKPFIRGLVNEPTDAVIDPEDEIRVLLSTEKDYGRIGKIFARKYQDILDAPLPDVLYSICTMANQYDDDADRIDAVVASLIERTTFLQIYHSSDMHTVPRPLKEILDSAYGDCKDISVLVAAGLNSMGYQAKVSLVNRTDKYKKIPYLPGVLQFNHAIVKAVASSGKIYWIDPTNDVTMACGIFPDIADRPALVLDADSPTYERIPPNDYRQSILKKETNIFLGEGEQVKQDGYIFIEGKNARKITQYLIKNPESVKKGLILDRISDNLFNPLIQFSESTGWIVRPLTASFNYTDNNALIRTNLGFAFSLAYSWQKNYISTSEMDVGGIFMGEPETIILKSIFRNVQAKNLADFEFSIQSPWLTAKREFNVTDNDIIATTTVEMIENYISAKDLKAQKFKDLRRDILKYCRNIDITFSKINQ